MGAKRDLQILKCSFFFYRKLWLAIPIQCAIPVTRSLMFIRFMVFKLFILILQLPFFFFFGKLLYQQYSLYGYVNYIDSLIETRWVNLHTVQVNSNERWPFLTSIWENTPSSDRNMGGKMARLVAFLQVTSETVIFVCGSFISETVHDTALFTMLLAGQSEILRKERSLQFDKYL